MAPTRAELAAVDEAHRTQQALNAQRVAQMVLTYWLLVDPEDVKGSGLAWLDRSTTAIVAGRTRSALLSAAYATQIKRLHFPGAQLVIPPARTVDVVPIRRSLAYTGLGNAALKVEGVKKIASRRDERPTEGVSRAIADIYRRQREIEGVTPGAADRALDRSVLELMETAGAAAAAATVRHVQNGGRQMIDDVVQSDRQAVGYVRIVRAEPCHFCSMLASRGPVFKDDSFDRSDPRFTGEGDVKVHDSCGCTLRPVYEKGPFAWPEQAEAYNEQWLEMKRHKSGELGLQEAWRRMQEGRPWRHDDPRVKVRAA